MKLFEGLALIASGKIEGIKRKKGNSEIKMYLNEDATQIIKEVDGRIEWGRIDLKVTRLDFLEEWEEFKTYSDKQFDIITIVYYGQRAVTHIAENGNKISLQQLHVSGELGPEVSLAIGCNKTNIDTWTSIIFEKEYSSKNTSEDKWLNSITDEG